MTRDEFEAYLKSIGGLVNADFPDRPNIVGHGFFSVGDGWLGLVADCIQELINAGWDKKVYQVKEKFGGLRFYCSVGINTHDSVSKYEELSYKTCEVCGKPGEPDQSRSWIKTLCPECTDLRRK